MIFRKMKKNWALNYYGMVKLPMDAVGERSGGSRWERRYRAAAVLLDVLAIILVVVIGDLLGLGDNIPEFGDVAPGVGVVAGC